MRKQQPLSKRTGRVGSLPGETRGEGARCALRGRAWPHRAYLMDPSETELDDLVREELGSEPSQEAMDYARKLYEQYRIPATAESEEDQSGS